MTGCNGTLSAAVCCHRGRLRQKNEDNYYFNGTWKAPEQLNENRLEHTTTAQPALFAVCDGMGGHQQGELAALVAVSWLHQSRQAFLAGEQPEEGVRSLIHMSRRFWRACQEQGRQMGSTIAAAAVQDNTLRIYGLGDSRVYRLAKGQLRQLTQDHTMAAEAWAIGLTGGKMPPSSDPRSHQLTQYFGMDCGEYDPAPCYGQCALAPGQRVLLCSDGLSDSLEHTQMGALLGRGTPKEAAWALVNAALEQGGRDNLTALVLEVQ